MNVAQDPDSSHRVGDKVWCQVSQSLLVRTKPNPRLKTFKTSKAEAKTTVLNGKSSTSHVGKAKTKDTEAA